MFELLLGGMGAFTAGLYMGRKSRRIPLRRTERRWSIGIYTGQSPFTLQPHDDVRNPVLTAKEVSDVRAEFVADPFMVKDGERWCMFFEVMNGNSRKGEIGLATSSEGLAWRYDRIVLDEPFHLSYPYVFEWEGSFYMIPETGQTKSVRLYRATDFPHRWELSKVLLEGYHFLDASLVHFRGTWWLFVSVFRNNILLLYHAENLEGPWTRHPESPVIMGDPAIARPGGRPVIHEGRVFRFTQDTLGHYGNKVRAFEIKELTKTSYSEGEIPQNPVVSATGSGWNALGMHTVDPHEVADKRWIACVDGEGVYTSFGFRK